MRNTNITRHSNLIWIGHGACCYKRTSVRRALCHSLTEFTEVPGKSIACLHNFQRFRARVQKCYRTHISSGHCCTGVQNSQKFWAGIKMMYPYPGYLWYWRTELTEVSGYGYYCRTELREVPGTGMNVLQNLHNFFVG